MLVMDVIKMRKPHQIEKELLFLNHKIVIVLQFHVPIYEEYLLLWCDSIQNSESDTYSTWI